MHSGIANPILSFLFKTSSGTIPRIAALNTFLVSPFCEIRKCSGIESRRLTMSNVKNGTLLSTEKRIEFCQLPYAIHRIMGA